MSQPTSTFSTYPTQSPVPSVYLLWEELHVVQMKSIKIS